jgi:hypothetical protein
MDRSDQNPGTAATSNKYAERSDSASSDSYAHSDSGSDNGDYGDCGNCPTLDEVLQVCIDISCYNEVQSDVKSWGNLMVRALDPHYSAVRYGRSWLFKWDLRGDEPCLHFVNNVLRSCMGDHAYSLKGELRRRCRSALWYVLQFQNKARQEAGREPKGLQQRPEAPRKAKASPEDTFSRTNQLM